MSSHAVDRSADEQAASAVADTAQRPFFAWHTRRFLIVFYGLAVALGVLDPADESSLGFLLSVGVVFSMAWWAITDASDRGRPLRRSLRVLVILIGWLAAPLYLLWTQRLKGLLWIVVNLIAFFAVGQLAFWAPRALGGALGLQW